MTQGMSRLQRIRLVPVDPDDDAFGDFADEQGWTMTDKSAHDIHQWRADDAVVSWVIDPETSVEFISIEGDARETVAAEIEKKFKMLKKQDFAKHIERVPNAQGRSSGLWQVAAAAPDEADADVVKLFERYLADDSPTIRQAALLAVTITGWKAFRERVEAMLEDPDATVRADAKETLQSLS
jgi:hypothetical protein